MHLTERIRIHTADGMTISDDTACNRNRMVAALDPRTTRLRYETFIHVALLCQAVAVDVAVSLVECHCDENDDEPVLESPALRHRFFRDLRRWRSFLPRG